MTPDDIYLKAMEAIQPAEEIEGLDPRPYIEAMLRIAAECNRRAGVSMHNLLQAGQMKRWTAIITRDIQFTEEDRRYITVSAVTLKEANLAAMAEMRNLGDGFCLESIEVRQ